MALETGGTVVTLEKEGGLAVLAAAGFELAQRGNFALDTQFHFTWIYLNGLHINAPTFQVGFTWH